jgi:hypothetical protein
MRKKRGYNRETPAELVKDYKVFAIACEGSKREPQYFNVFKYMSTRIKVDVIEDVSDSGEIVSNKSSPTWVLDRAVKYVEKEGLLDDDYLYFVIDTDRWSFEQINTLAEYCSKYTNWNLVISNPCFEVWLYFHRRGDIENSESDTCEKFKSEISSFDKGGYHPYKFLPYVFDAIANAKAADSNPGHFMPEFKESKVYQLVESLMSVVGANGFRAFIDTTLPKLIKDDIDRVKAIRKTKS